MECLKVRRLLPWPPKAGLFADFAHAVDRVLEAEEQEHRARPDRFSDGLWKCRAEAWRRRHHTKALGSTAGKLQRAVGRRMVELEARMRRREAPSGASELRELLAVEVEVWTSELQQLADPLVWAADGSLLQDVGPVRSGCFLLGDAHLQKLTGRALEQKLEELHDMSGWYIPNHPADVPRALAVGVPILDAICSQMRLLDAWASRQETREATEQWCSRSFASAMLSVSTLQQRSRGSSSEPLALPAWWLKAALGHGGHSSRYVSDLSQLASPSESGRYLLQEDKADCILLDERRFTLRLYLVIVAGHAFLASKGLVYRALGTSKVTNCSRAALTLKGAANAANAREAPDLQWLEQRLEHLPQAEGGGPGSYARLWRRLRRLGTWLAQGALRRAARSPLGELTASDTERLPLPKILGMDVILSKTSPGLRMVRAGEHSDVSPSWRRAGRAGCLAVAPGDQSLPSAGPPQ
ncbi:unnamed protein product [Durusdinium trenchii]|uniref:Uncharacterized protein n=1 Tax=Durusdinium trenchii TaxID=1381693 RepID=A0ABP0KQ08_9DINO